MAQPLRIALAALVLAMFSARAQAAELRFPAYGTPFPEAKSLLLRQGLAPAPDKPRRPDRRYPDLDCFHGSVCEALFIFRDSDGWGEYVVVLAHPAKALVVDTYFARPADGHPAIPPPEPPDVPKLKGAYFVARQRLRELGYVPMRTVGEAARVCLDVKCHRLGTLPEAQCAMDIPICNTFWRGPDGRVLKVMTIGETRAGNIYYVTWSSHREQRELTR
jgi:hypothetical protein